MPELRREFGVPVVAIVRDGRYVVRSLMARGCYQREGYPPIEADHIQGVEGRARLDWDTVSAFAKCCWYWATTYRLLERQNVPLYYLEKLNADYDYFEGLCDVLGLTVQQGDWQQHAGKRTNVSVEDEGPPVWGAAQWAQFGALAGDVQRRLGYPL